MFKASVFGGAFLVAPSASLLAPVVGDAFFTTPSASLPQTFFSVETLTLHCPHHTLILFLFILAQATCLNHLSQAPLVDPLKISPVSQRKASASGCCQTQRMKLCSAFQSPLPEHHLLCGSFFLSLRLQGQVSTRVICPGSGIQSSHLQVATSVDRLCEERAD